MTHSNAYAANFKVWQVKVLGSKPTDDLLAVAHAFGKPGKQSLALAMAMRPEGMTAPQMVIACGAPQNNHRVGLVRGGLFKRDMNAAKNDLGHTVYKITLTPKGEAAMKRRTEALAATTATGDAAKPAKAKAKVSAKSARKAERKAKVKAVSADTNANATPQAEPAPVVETVAGEACLLTDRPVDGDAPVDQPVALRDLH